MQYTFSYSSSSSMSSSVYFEVLGTMKNNADLENLIATYHWDYERAKKHKAIEKVFNGRGILLKSFIVDKGHKKGAEIHNVYSSGVCVIQNYNSRELVTEIVLTAYELRRYWDRSGKGEELSIRYNRLVEVVRKNCVMGLNDNDTLYAEYYAKLG